MARLLFLLAHSTNDPDRASTALVTAARVAASGHEVSLWLSGEGVRLGVDGVAEALREGDASPAADGLSALADGGAVLHVSAPCFRKRKFDAAALHASARLAEPEELARLVDAGWTPLAV